MHQLSPVQLHVSGNACMRFISLGTLLQPKLSGATLYTLAQLVPTPKASTFNRQMMNLGEKKVNLDGTQKGLKAIHQESACRDI
jgi:catechol-2,3-dioxygenase